MVNVNHIKKARYCLQVSVCVIYIKLKEAHSATGSIWSPMEWLKSKTEENQMCHYWNMILCLQIDILLFIRSIRVSDFHIYVHCVSRISLSGFLRWIDGLYARWLSSKKNIWWKREGDDGRLHLGIRFDCDENTKRALIQKPHFVINCWRTLARENEYSLLSIRELSPQGYLYLYLWPLEICSFSTPKEKDIVKWLKKYIKLLKVNILKFCCNFVFSNAMQDAAREQNIAKGVNHFNI